MQLKRILVMLLVAIMMLSLAVVAVSAADDAEVFDIAVESNSTADAALPLKPGKDTLEVKVVIENNPGAAYIDIQIDYDGKALTPVMKDGKVDITVGGAYEFTSVNVVVNRITGRSVLQCVSDNEALTTAKGALLTVKFDIVSGFEGNTIVNVTPKVRGLTNADIVATSGKTTLNVAASACNFNKTDAEVVAPTCSAQGYTLLKCTDQGCDKTIKTDFTEINPENHANIVDVAATATHYAGKKCADCDTIVEGCGTTCTHPNFEEIEALNATCTAAGYTAGKQCTDCQTIFEGYLYVAPLEHVIEDVDAVPATCTTAGATAGKVCSVCNAVVEGCEPVAPKHGEEADVPGFEATCTSIGLTDGKKCTVCNAITVAQEVIPTIPHTEKVLEAVEANCAADGLTEGKQCEVCGKVTVPQEVVPAPLHSVVDLEAVEATCKSTGLTAGEVCEICDTIIIAQEIIPVSTHNSDVVIPAVAATCTAAGSTEGAKCSVCDVVVKAPEVVQPKGHTEEVIPAVDATKDNDGSTEGKKCTVCGEITDATGVIPAIATSMAWLWVLIAAVVVIGALVAVYFFVLRKKS